MGKLLCGKKPRGLALLTAVLLVVSGISFAGASDGLVDSGARQDSGGILSGVRLLDADGNDMAAQGRVVDALEPVTIEYICGPGGKRMDSGALDDLPGRSGVIVEAPPELDLTNAVFDGAEGAVLGAQKASVRLPAGGGSFTIQAAFNAGRLTDGGERTLRFTLADQSRDIHIRFKAEQAAFSGTEQPFDFLTSVKVTKKDGDTPLGSNVSKSESIRVTYTYQMPDPGQIVPGVPYYFDLPDKVIIQDKATLLLKILDEGLLLAEGTVDAATNHATVVFNADNGDRKSGTFFFEAGFHKDKIENTGKQKIEFLIPQGGGNAGKPFNPEPEIDFMIDQVTAQVTLKKDGTKNLKDKKISWSITAAPRIEYAQDSDRKITNWEITDTIPEGITLDKASWKIAPVPDGALSAQDGFSYDDSARKMTYRFPETLSIDNATDYVITFDTTLEMAGFDGVASRNFKNVAESNEFEYPQYEKGPDGTAQVAPDSAKAKKVTAEKTVSVSSGTVTKSGKVTGDKEITWTIKATNALLLTAPQITDTLPVGITPKGSLPNGASSTIDPQTGAVELTIPLDPNVDTEQTVTLVTEVDSSLWGAGKKIENTARMSGGTGVGTGTASVTSKPGTVSMDGSLLKKTGQYDSRNHTIKWTINVGAAGAVINGPLKVTDTIQSGQTYVPGTLKAAGSSGAADSAAPILTVEYTGPITGIQTITFMTTVDDAHAWATNQTGRNYSNNVALEQGGTTIAQNTGTVKVASNLLKKAAIGEFNVKNKRVSWKLTVNENKMELHGAKITDKIVDGWAFVEGSLNSGLAGIRSSYDAASRLLTISLPDMRSGEGPYDITYETELTDLSILQNSQDDQPAVTNTAQIQGQEIPDDATVSGAATHKITKSTVSKSGKDTGGNSIRWTVLINNNLLTLIDPVIVDEFAEGLKLDPFSVKLYQLELKDNGAVEKVAEPVDDGNIAVSTGSNGRETLTFSFTKTITSAYQLEFETFFQKSGTYANAVRMTGGDLTQLSGSASVQASYSASGGNSGTKRGIIRIEKVDDGGQPVKGAVFQVGAFEAATDAKGIAEIKEVPPGTYTVKEVKVPDGYLPSSPDSKKVIVQAEQTSTIPFVNARIKGELMITKTDADTGVPLPGAAFAVYDAANAQVAAGTTDAAGKVVFQALPYGNYTCKEAAAPTGYQIDDSQAVPFMIRSNGQMVEKAFQNSQILHRLIVTKVDEGEPIKKLAGAKFTLTPDNLPGMTAQSAATGPDGTVVFQNLRAGSYTLTETQAPMGYVAANAVAVEVPLDGKTEPITMTVANRKITGGVEIQKTSGAHGTPLTIQGVKIALYRKGETLPFDTIETDSDGIARKAGLDYGEYRFKEVEPPTGYYLNEDEVHFSIKADGETVLAELPNMPIPPEPPTPPEPPVPPSPDSGTGSFGSRGSSGGGGGSSGGSSASGGGLLNPLSDPGTAQKPDAPGSNAPQGYGRETFQEMTPQDTPKEGIISAPPDSHFVLTDPPKSGTVEVRGDGGWLYTPSPGFRGTDRFTVEVREPGGRKRPVEVLVTIEEPPIPKSPANTGMYQ